MSATDILVVGRGLAGTLLALELEKRGRSVMIIDDGLRDAASVVAAGLLNPVTGMRLSATPGADTLIPTTIATFRELEQKFGRTLFRETPIFRAYENEAERALKARRAAEPAYARWFGEEFAPGTTHPALNAPLGGFMILGGGWADLPALLEATGEYFQNKGALIDERFVHADLEILPNGAGIRYHGIEARHIVFAEGAAVAKNPWFSHLPWQPAKGEFITCQTDRRDGPDFALKIGLIAVPLGDGRWRAGSNYEWGTLDTTPTPAVRDELLRKFEKMFLGPTGAVVLEHRAGIRPAAQGAKPIVGPHAEFPALHVFNGFGAKGCTWAPSYAQVYATRLSP